MLPFEAHLLAAGWPRWEDAPAGSNGGEGQEDEEGRDGSGGERVLAREGSRAARMLFMARRCEAAEGAVGWVQATAAGRHAVVQSADMPWHAMAIWLGTGSVGMA